MEHVFCVQVVFQQHTKNSAIHRHLSGGPLTPNNGEKKNTVCAHGGGCVEFPAGEAFFWCSFLLCALGKKKTREEERERKGAAKIRRGGRRPVAVAIPCWAIRCTRGGCGAEGGDEGWAEALVTTRVVFEDASCDCQEDCLVEWDRFGHREVG